MYIASEAVRSELGRSAELFGGWWYARCGPRGGWPAGRIGVGVGLAGVGLYGGATRCAQGRRHA